MLSPEGNVKKRVKALLKKYDILPFLQAVAHIEKGEWLFGYYSMPSSSGYGEAGIGDFLINLNGNYMEVETKTINGKLRGIQRKHRDVITAARGIYVVIKEENDILAFENTLAANHQGAKMRHEMEVDYKRGMH